jgi:hypothetical protein
VLESSRIISLSINTRRQLAEVIRLCNSTLKRKGDRASRISLLNSKPKCRWKGECDFFKQNTIKVFPYRAIAVDFEQALVLGITYCCLVQAGTLLELDRLSGMSCHLHNFHGVGLSGKKDTFMDLSCCRSPDFCV